jgi:hypothetical protein
MLTFSLVSVVCLTVSSEGIEMVTLVIDLYRRNTDTCLTIFIDGIPESMLDDAREILVALELAKNPDFELVYACKAQN